MSDPRQSEGASDSDHHQQVKGKGVVFPDLVHPFLGPQGNDSWHDNRPYRQDQRHRDTDHLLGVLVVPQLPAGGPPAQHQLVHLHEDRNADLRDEQQQGRLQVGDGIPEPGQAVIHVPAGRRQEQQVPRKGAARHDRRIFPQVRFLFYQRKDQDAGNDLYRDVPQGHAPEFLHALKQPDHVDRRGGQVKKLYGGDQPEPFRRQDRVQDIDDASQQGNSRLKRGNLRKSPASPLPVPQCLGHQSLPVGVESQHAGNEEIVNDRESIRVVADPLRMQHPRNIRCRDQGNDNRQNLIGKLINKILF